MHEKILYACYHCFLLINSNNLSKIHVADDWVYPCSFKHSKFYEISKEKDNKNFFFRFTENKFDVWYIDFTDSAMSEPDDHYRSSRMAEAHSRLSVRTPRYESSKIHSVDSYVQNTIDTLPQTMDRIAQLRSVS